MQDGTERCEMVQDAWSVATAQTSERENLLVEEGTSKLEGASSPTRRLVMRIFLFLELLEKQHLGELLHVEHFKGLGSSSN